MREWRAISKLVLAKILALKATQNANLCMKCIQKGKDKGTRKIIGKISTINSKKQLDKFPKKQKVNDEKARDI